jgi:hypothetical protein
MQKRILGKSGLEVSALMIAVIRAAVARGVTFLVGR